jgi:hypothetical protein
LFTRRNVFDNRDEVIGGSVRFVRKRDGQVGPHDGAVLPTIALLSQVGLNLTREHPLHCPQVGRQIAPVGDVTERLRQQLVAGVPEDVAQPLVHFQETPVQRDACNTDSCIREDGPEPRIVVGDRRHAMFDSAQDLDPSAMTQIHNMS